MTDNTVIKIQRQGDVRAPAVTAGPAPGGSEFERVSVASRSSDAMSVLSRAPGLPVRRGVSVLGATAAQSLILVTLFGGLRSLPVPVDPPAVELVQVPPEVPPAPVEPAAPAESPADAPEQTAAAFDGPPRDAPGPAPLAPEAAVPPDPVPVAVQDPVPEPPVQPVVAPVTEAVLPQPPPLPLARPSIRQSVRPAAPRPAGLRATTSAAPAHPDTVAIAAARTAVSANSAVASRVEETLLGRIRQAVQEAVRCPAAAAMMGLSGKAGVTFDYRDGAIAGDTRIARTAGSPLLDKAALSAVRGARYPTAPPEEAGHTLHLLIWIEAACGG